MNLSELKAKATNNILRIVNLSAVLGPATSCTMFRYNGKDFEIPLATKMKPWVAILADDAVNILRIYGGRPDGGSERAFTPARGTCGLRPWVGESGIPENELDRDTMAKIEQQARVVSGAEPPPVVGPEQVIPWAPRPTQEEFAVSVMPDASWSPEMLAAFLKENSMTLVNEKGSHEKRLAETVNLTMDRIKNRVPVRRPRMA